MADRPILHVCSYGTGGPAFHPCRRVAAALDKGQIAYDTNVFDRNRPLGLFTAGKRPELKALSGQEKLPVLELPDGSTISGSGAIVAWARAGAGRVSAG
jgi:glutathione S-transferase